MREIGLAQAVGDPRARSEDLVVLDEQIERDPAAPSSTRRSRCLPDRGPPRRKYPILRHVHRYERDEDQPPLIAKRLPRNNQQQCAEQRHCEPQRETPHAFFGRTVRCGDGTAVPSNVSDKSPPRFLPLARFLPLFPGLGGRLFEYAPGSFVTASNASGGDHIMAENKIWLQPDTWRSRACNCG